MAEFQVRAMADGGSPEDLPQRGRVTEVCREWLLHEDQALAYRLQNEEYQSHLGNNRERNQLLRQDTPKAKEEQIREDHEAALAQTAYELALAQQEARDADLAANLALKLNVQDMEKQKQQEEQDMLYARCLMEREKESIRQNRELRQVEREAAYLGINSGSDNVALLSRKERRERDVNGTVSSDRSAQSNTSGVSSDLSDLSDFCLQPTEDMDEEEQRVLQEGQDAERAKAKKAREKARQKALQKKQSQLAHLPPEFLLDPSGPSTQSGRGSNSPLRSLPATSEQPGPSGYTYQESRLTDYTSSSPTYMSPDSPNEDSDGDLQDPRGRPLQRPNSLDLPGTSHSSYAVSHSEKSKYAHHQFPLGKTNKPRLPDPEAPAVELVGSSASSSSMEQTPAMGFTNIACAIDPTYQRRVMRGELASPHSSSSSSSTSSGTGGLAGPSIGSPISPLPPPVFDDDDDYPVPPYMPIQGQRRTASLEKNHRLKAPKEKSSSKDGCKQQ
nr:coiled-coil domain-containing protein 50-like isoform X4 [Procambarus clarkii]